MYVKVRVVADAKKERVVRTDDTHFEITVREPASMNRANGRVRELVAEAFVLPVGKVRIISGHQSPSKILSVDTEV